MSDQGKNEESTRISQQPDAQKKRKTPELREKDLDNVSGGVRSGDPCEGGQLQRR